MRYNHIVYISLFILAVLFSNFAFTQSLQVITASAKLKDVDNNGYANIGDSLSFQV